MILGITGAPGAAKWGHSVVLGACRRRFGADWSLGPAVAPAPAKSAGCRSTLESGIRSAVIIPMRQQPGPMLIFRFSKYRRGRLDLRRHASNPHSVPGTPVIPTAPRSSPLWRHHELKNTGAARGHTLQPRPAPGIKQPPARWTSFPRFHLSSEGSRVEALGTSYLPVYPGR
jgi:hypothetical protein